MRSMSESVEKAEPSESALNITNPHMTKNMVYTCPAKESIAEAITGRAEGAEELTGAEELKPSALSGMPFWPAPGECATGTSPAARAFT